MRRCTRTPGAATAPRATTTSAATTPPTATTPGLDRRPAVVGPARWSVGLVGRATNRAGGGLYLPPQRKGVLHPGRRVEHLRRRGLRGSVHRDRTALGVQQRGGRRDGLGVPNGGGGGGGGGGPRGVPPPRAKEAAAGGASGASRPS